MVCCESGCALHGESLEITWTVPFLQLIFQGGGGSRDVSPNCSLFMVSGNCVYINNYYNGVAAKTTF